ncbi:MAG: GTP cyclohydrolase I FolE [Promethearchaeota archaeon]
MDTEELIRQLLIDLGEDPDREGLKNTPHRTAKAMKFLTQGYNQDIKEIINGALFECESDDMIIVKNIELYSMCEHHMLPFFGKCHLGYIPQGTVIGLSKVARIVDVFSRRFQIQERLTKQIAETVMEITNASGVAVVIEAQHLCMMMRGVQKQNSVMTTSSMIGIFRKDSKTRAEFLSLIEHR